MGCGTGKHDFELSKLGYITTGIDLSTEMIDVASVAKTCGGGRGIIVVEKYIRIQENVFCGKSVIYKN